MNTYMLCIERYSHTTPKGSGYEFHNYTATEETITGYHAARRRAKELAATNTVGAHCVTIMRGPLPSMNSPKGRLFA